MIASVFDAAEQAFLDLGPDGSRDGSDAHWSLRLVDDAQEVLCVRRGVVLPPASSRDAGAMITVGESGGGGYAATCDLSPAGLRSALDAARAWARLAAGRWTGDATPPSAARGAYRSPCLTPWESVPLADRLDRLRRAAEALGAPERVVDWEAQLWHTRRLSRLVTSTGGRIEQEHRWLVPMLRATANDGGETQTRTFGGHARVRQGGLEQLEATGFDAAPARIAEEACALLDAPDCPSGRMDVVLAPDQMVLQIHESIGHPLELDRILGDERNYAGTSFVRPEMFGSYRYGSELLDVTFTPDRAGEFASYAFDDEGTPAERAHLIRNGILLRGLGGATSQARSGLPGVASTRASGWSRPPIDRMANLDLEPGASSFADLVAGVERGVYLETNCSWSIDDARNKFQFGCERGRLIRNGELGPVVRKPNYRGLSATFWRSLTGVGDAATVEVLGTPWCGKGEPNQLIRVGHAAPACRFADVEVFGGA